MCFDLGELNLKVVMIGMEMRVEMVGKVVGWGESCGDGGIMEVVWIREGCNCVEVLGTCN